MSRDPNAPLTDQERDLYVSGDFNRCPFCRTLGELEGHETDSTGPEIHVKVHCNRCDRGWTEVYQLIGIRPD